MTVIRRTNPLGKRLALRRVLDRTNQRQEQPARPANDSPRDESEIRPTVDQGSREVGA